MSGESKRSARKRVAAPLLDPTEARKTDAADPTDNALRRSEGPQQQAVLMLHKTRDLLVRQRTRLINALRARLAEYGIISSKGPGGVTT
jgi:transposase